jgi:serine/threonine protein kinase
MIRAGDTIDRYKVMGKLANGGMASVYLARDMDSPDGRHLVVLKAILPHLAANPDYVAMFERECSVGQVAAHPNVVHIDGLLNWEGRPVLVMEFLDGRNLIQVISAARRRQQAISFSVVGTIVAAVSNALHNAWTVSQPDGQQAMIVHRDISPENVVLTYDGKVKLVDFGIAKHSHVTGDTLAGQLKGKYSYMSPEQIRGEGVDHRTDQYSLGVLLYILLTGRKPFVADSDVELLRLIVGEDPTPPSQIDPSIPGVLEQVALRCLRKAMEARFPDHNAVAVAIEDRFLARQVGSAHDISNLMTTLFPVTSDPVRMRIRMLISAEREGSNTGVYPIIPEPGADDELNDETVLEDEFPSIPTVNWRVSGTGTGREATAEIEPDDIGEETRLVPAVVEPPAAERQSPARTVTRSRVRVAVPKPPKRRLRPTTAALLALGLAALVGALLALTGRPTTPLVNSAAGQGALLVVRSPGVVAHVRLNGEDIGNSPVQKKVPAGPMSILCSFKDRQVVLRRRLVITDGKQEVVLCQPGRGHLTINGPTGWKVAVDNKPPSVLPIGLVHTMEGTYRLTWTRPGNVPVMRKVVVKPGGRITVRHWNDLP